MAQSPEISLRQICQTTKTKMLLVQQKLTSTCNALSGKQYVRRRFQSPQNTSFHTSAIYNLLQSNQKSTSYPKSLHKVLKTNALGAMQKESGQKIHICRPPSLGFVNFDCVYG
jgi:dynactin complex subunit